MTMAMAMAMAMVMEMAMTMENMLELGEVVVPTCPAVAVFEARLHCEVIDGDAVSVACVVRLAADFDASDAGRQLHQDDVPLLVARWRLAAVHAPSEAAGRHAYNERRAAGELDEQLETLARRVDEVCVQHGRVRTPVVRL